MTRFARAEWDSRPVVAECPWFQIVEDQTLATGFDVIRSEAVERAYWQTVFRIIDDRGDGAISSQGERMAWALAVLRLATFTQSADFDSPDLGGVVPIGVTDAMKGKGGSPVAVRLAHTIGRKLASLHNVPRDRVDTAINDCVAAFSGALRAYAAATFLKPDKRSNHLFPIEQDIITHAGLIFLRTREHPTKKAVRSELEACGVTYNGTEKKQRELWRKAFEAAGLSAIPSS